MARPKVGELRAKQSCRDERQSFEYSAIRHFFEDKLKRFKRLTEDQKNAVRLRDPRPTRRFRINRVATNHVAAGSTPAAETTGL